ncbi:MAG: hypothetical protein GC137_02725 [Alphaproteobacteria bacterium]|nr:hypothetical protein [Alphaproteobacteria bacterium]
MEQQLNSAGIVYLANVSLSEAVAFDPATDDRHNPASWGTLEANDYDKDQHGKHQFFCPCCLDNGDEVRLRRPSTGHFQEIQTRKIKKESGLPLVDEEGKPITETRRYQIPPRFSLFPGQKHTCDLATNDIGLVEEIKRNGGITLNSQTGAYIVNLHLAAGQKAVSLPRSSSGDDFNKASHATSNPRRRVTSSKAITSIEGLAKLLDHTEILKDRRADILLRNGSQIISLADAYGATTADLYHGLFARELDAQEALDDNRNHLAIFRFQPGGLKSRSWKEQPDGSMTVESHPQRFIDNDGHEFVVSTRINFTRLSAFEKFAKDYDRAGKGNHWFLVYTEHAHVGTQSYFMEKDSLNKGYKRQGRLMIDAKVFDPDQIMLWTPRSPQLLIDFGNQPLEDLDPSLDLR